LSVTDVAEQVGVSTASIYFWETDSSLTQLATGAKAPLKLPIKATKGVTSA
jgi:DNA-binding XRE family transcriptional regulator